MTTAIRSPLLLSELTATSPVEFRQLLKKISEHAGFTCGQIAVKAKIPRSQAYNLVSTSRTTLPTQAKQVQAFLEACKLPATQVSAVMDVWRRLKDEAEMNKAASSSSATTLTFTVGDDKDEGFPSFVSASSRWKPPQDFGDFLIVILSSPDRTARALRLLYPLVGAFLLYVALLATMVWMNHLTNEAFILLVAPAGGAPFMVTSAILRRKNNYRRRSG